MTLSLLAPVIAFRVLAQTALAPSPSQTPWALFALVLVSLILFAALTGLLTVLARRAFTESTQADQPRRGLVAAAWGFDRGSDADAAPADSVPHLRVLQPGSSTKSDPSGAGVARGRVHVPASPRSPLG